MAYDALVVRDLDAGYGAVRVLHGVSLRVPEGQIVALLGTNGNGKSTLMKAILGLVKPTRGTVRARLDGREVDLTGRATEEIVDLGVVLVPEGRRLFRDLTVEENLVLGAWRACARREISGNLRLCFETFPRLGERRRQRVGSMSGGEQQMVAIGRALMSMPRILLVDEPSVGLAPIMVKQTIETIGALKAKLGLTVLMAEQNFTQAIRIADRGSVLVHGSIAFEGETAESLGDNHLVRQFYLGT
ncbi:ABC transporter ATP-binding protein [Aquabacter spiritensis]|uniref:Branched-chain amino acid transport system ATP-binding protein n=1 Tax=Aquabacter spiritensis TaxID=933073 RepID=A0A4R3LR70_9HYPH|nr:ABC transporter ATP-binding protein [Aquabacter spiritensis]TCT02206.1 branched-chain amino acid transport system ATP-binding protein [Aquabacter spiritensis]